MIIIRIIPQLFFIDSAINKYFPELLYSVVKSIELTYNNSKNTSKNISCDNDTVLEVLDKLLKVIERKSSIFFKANETRRKPPGFGDATIIDIAIWLLTYSKNAYRPLANRCFFSFINICKLIELENNSTPDKFVQKLIENNGINSIISKYIKHDEFSFDANDFEKLHECIHKFYVIFDIYVNILKSGIFPINIFSSETLNLRHTIIQFELFLQFFTKQNLDSVFDNFFVKDKQIGKYYKSTTILKHSFENMIFKTMWKFFDFSFYLKSDVFDIDVIKDSVSQALISTIFDTQKLKILKRNITDMEIKNFFLNLQNKMSNVWSIFKDLIFDEMVKIFQTLDINLCSDSETTYEFLSTLSGMVTSFDSGKKEILLHCFKKIDMSNFFDSLFITRNDGNLLAKTSLEISSLIKPMSYLLEFILGFNAIKLKVILKNLIRDRIIMNFDEKFFSKKNNITYGEFCFEYFKNKIIDYIIKNSEQFFDELFKIFSLDNKFLCIKLINQILQYSSERSISDVSFYQNLFSFLSKVNIHYILL